MAEDVAEALMPVAVTVMSVPPMLRVILAEMEPEPEQLKFRVPRSREKEARTALVAVAVVSRMVFLPWTS